jgi:hypothetical protein
MPRQTRFVAGQPGLRVDDAAALVFKFRLHPVERVLQPGDDPDRRRFGDAVDRLGKLRPLQREVRFQALTAPVALDAAVVAVAT